MIPNKLRPATSEDRNFVSSSYAASWQNGGDLCWVNTNLPERGNAKPWFDHEIDKRLAVMWSSVVVVEGEVGLLGWGSAQGDTLHYVYVKQPYRHERLGNSIWKWFGGPKQASHWTRAMARWKLYDSNRIASLIYVPTFWRDYKS